MAGDPKKPTKGSIDPAESKAAARKLLVESLLARRMQTREIVRAVQAEFPAHERTIYKDIDDVRALWLQESANAGDRDRRRMELRYAMEDTLQRALDHAVPARDLRGDVVTRLNEATGERETVMVPDPNLGAAARLLDTLARLDGLYHFPLELKVQENVEKLLDSVKGKMTRDAYEQLVRAIVAISGHSGVGAAGAPGDRA